MISRSRASSPGVTAPAAEAIERRQLMIADRRSRERSTNLTAVLGSLAVLTVLLLVGNFSGVMSIIVRPTTIELPVDIARRSFHKTRTGQIVFVPLTGNLCRKVLFNNETGLFGEGDRVLCEDILRQSAPAVANDSDAALRLGAVRDAFLRR
jgi:hypothetical protein